MYDERARRQALESLARGRTLSDVSRLTGISRSALREWASGGARRPTAHACPVCGDVPLSRPDYAALLGFYLGDGCLSQAPRYFALRVSCDRTLPGIIDDVERRLRAVRPTGKVFRVHAPGVVVVQSHWQHWICLFPQHGPGRKHERLIELEPWQRAIIEQHPAEFLRGLFHSDGSRTKNWASRVVGGERRRYDYARWEFANRSEDIMELCRWALDLVEVPHRTRTPERLAVSRREAVARLDERIGLKS